MDRIPAYLLVYFLRIRGHQREERWLLQRVAKKTPEDALDEISMLRLLSDLSVITVCEDVDEVTLPGAHGPETFNVPREFAVLARGNHIWSDVLGDAALWLISSVLGAVIGAIATVLIVGA